jgi:hypothetical protein
VRTFCQKDGLSESQVAISGLVRQLGQVLYLQLHSDHEQLIVYSSISRKVWLRSPSFGGHPLSS